MKVARTALQNATSIVSMLLTTEAIVAEVPEKKEKAAGASMPGARTWTTKALNGRVLVIVTTTLLLQRELKITPSLRI